MKAAKQEALVFNEGKGLSTREQQYDPTPIINEVRGHVAVWRSLPNPSQWGVTPETARLLQHWRQHTFSSVRPFFCQVEALETAIWLTEVAPKLTNVQRTNRPLYRAYLLKETLARILDGGQVNVARDKLVDWIGWAARSRLPPFRRVARTIKQRDRRLRRHRLQQRTQRGPQRQDTNDHPTQLRLPLRLQPHRPHPPLLRRPHALAGAQVRLTLPRNLSETDLIRSPRGSLAGCSRTDPSGPKYLFVGLARELNATKARRGSS